MCHVPIPRLGSFLCVLERGKTDIMPDKTDFPESRGWSPKYSRDFDVAKIPA